MAETVESKSQKVTVKIVTDSTCDIPLSLAHQLNIEIIPLKLLIEEKIWLDGVDITPQGFYKRLPHLEKIPGTSQPTPEEFASVYEKAVSEGYEVLSLHLSAKMSGTYNSAALAARQLEEKSGVINKIRIFDTELVSAGAAMFVIKAARMAQDGATLEEIETTLNQMREKQAVKIITTVDTLDYLRKGGRLSTAKHILGSVLQVKPIMHFKDGQPHLLEQVRTRPKLFKRVAELVGAILTESGQHQFEKVIIIHAEDEEGANTLAELLNPLFPKEKIEKWYMGPVVGAHSGPKALGVALEISRP